MTLNGETLLIKSGHPCDGYNWHILDSEYHSRGICGVVCIEPVYTLAGMIKDTYICKECESKTQRFDEEKMI